MQDEAGDDFEWTRQTGSTRSSGTGPTAGQTTSQGSGELTFLLEVVLLSICD